jgi:hypothetical protein
MNTSNSENSSIPDTAGLIEKEIELLSFEVKRHDLFMEEQEAYRWAHIMAFSTLGFIVPAAIASVVFALLLHTKTIPVLGQRELIFKVSVPALASAGVVGFIAERRSR